MSVLEQKATKGTKGRGVLESQGASVGFDLFRGES